MIDYDMGDTLFDKTNREEMCEPKHTLLCLGLHLELHDAGSSQLLNADHISLYQG